MASSWDPSEATPLPDGRPDTAIVPYVEALRERGVETLQSCAGHQPADDADAPDYVKNGHLVWVADGRFDPEEAAESAAFECVRKEYQRYREPAWEVWFPGLAVSEAALEQAMDVLFAALGVTDADD